MRRKKKKKTEINSPPQHSKEILTLDPNIEAIQNLDKHKLIRKVSLWKATTRPWNIPAYMRYQEYLGNPDKRIGVNMELNNGHFLLFTIAERMQGFKYKKQKYLFDIKSKYLVTNLDMYFYDFHEDISLPIKRHIPSDAIKTTVEEYDGSETAYALNPRTLERFEVSKIAEGIMKGQAIDAMLMILLIGLVILIFIALITMIVVVWKLQVFNFG